MGVIADKIRRAIFGGEVRDSIADGIEVVEQLREDYDNQVINAGNSNAEIVDARGGQTKLKDRLDNFDEQLDKNVNKLESTKVDKGGNEQITLAMLSQEVKTAITGGSVGVVGVNSVNTSNVVDKAINQNKFSDKLTSDLFEVAKPYLDWFYKLKFEKGVFAYTPDSAEFGKDIVSNTRIRSKNIIRVYSGTTINAKSGYKFTFVCYNENDVTSPQSKTFPMQALKWKTTYTFNADCFIRIAIANTDDSVIDDVATFNDTLTFSYSNTDKWVLGVIDFISGNMTATTSTNRIVKNKQGYIKSGETIYVDNGYKYGYVIVSSDLQGTLKENSTQWLTTPTTVTHSGYYKITVGKTDDSVITDIENIANHIHIDTQKGLFNYEKVSKFNRIDEILGNANTLLNNILGGE